MTERHRLRVLAGESAERADVAYWELRSRAEGDVPPCKAVGCDESAVSEVGWCEEHDEREDR